MLSKISLIVSSLLLVLVVILFVRLEKITSASPDEAPKEKAMEMPSNSVFADTGKVRTPVVAYINGDSIMAKYKFFLDKKSTFEASLRSSENKVLKQMDDAQKEYNELMAYAEKQGDKLKEDEARTIQTRIMELEHELNDLKEKEDRKLMEGEKKINDQLMERIQEYLGKYTAANNIDMVFNYQQLAQIILYAGTPFDITADVVNGLNAEYEKEKATGAKK